MCNYDYHRQFGDRPLEDDNSVMLCGSDRLAVPVPVKAVKAKAK